MAWGFFLCVPGMVLMLEVKVLCGPGEGNREPKATASPRGGVGRKPEAKFGPDEQEPDTRPARWDNPALDGDFQFSPGHARR